MPDYLFLILQWNRVARGGRSVQSAMPVPSYLLVKAVALLLKDTPQQRRVQIHQQDQTATAIAMAMAMAMTMATSMGLLPFSFREYIPVLHQPQQQQQQQQQATTAATTRSITTTAAVGVLSSLRESFPVDTTYMSHQNHPHDTKE